MHSNWQGAHRDTVELTELTLESNRLLIPRIHKSVGARVRVHVRALDITLALAEPREISANNVLPARISEISAAAGAYADVRLALDKATLLARITRYSAERLGLAVGDDVFAIIKSVTVDRGDGALGAD